MISAASLQQENVILKTQLAESHRVLEEKDKQLDTKNHRIQLLEELIKQFQRKTFSSSSEKISPDQLRLFNEAEAIELNDVDQKVDGDAVEIKAHRRIKKPRVSIPDDYPREVIEYDLTDEEKICPRDGTTLRHIGSEDHEQLDIVPTQINVICHRRLKYACPCCEQHVMTANKPTQPIEKSIAAPGLLAHIAVQKYADALPLYHQATIFKRLGIELDRTNLANWMIRCGELVQPLINVLQDRLLEQPVIHMDETTLQVLEEPGKTAESNSYLWLLASFTEDPIILFHYHPSRSQQWPIKLLSEEVQALMVDGYEGYQPACEQYHITRLGCWAHARRKFVDAQKLQPKGKTGKPDQLLAYIQALYRIEKTIKHHPPDERYRIRQQQSKPLIDKMRKWLIKNLSQVPPKTALGKALYYLDHQWPRLVRYLEDGHYPMDNNSAENAIRPFAVGRKNWLFAKSQAGARASANLYGLIETAKANQLNPFEYLKVVFKELPNAQTLEQIEVLLPSQYKLTVDE